MMKTYTTKQLTELRERVSGVDKMQDQISNALEIMCKGQHKPFCNFASPDKVIDILDPILGDILSYVLYECSGIDKPCSVDYLDGRKAIITGSNLESFLTYCNVQGLVKHN